MLTLKSVKERIEWGITLKEELIHLIRDIDLEVPTNAIVYPDRIDLDTIDPDDDPLPSDTKYIDADHDVDLWSSSKVTKWGEDKREKLFDRELISLLKRNTEYLNSIDKSDSGLELLDLIIVSFLTRADSEIIYL